MPVFLKLRNDFGRWLTFAQEMILSSGQALKSFVIAVNRETLWSWNVFSKGHTVIPVSQQFSCFSFNKNYCLVETNKKFPAEVKFYITVFIDYWQSTYDTLTLDRQIFQHEQRSFFFMYQWFCCYQRWFVQFYCIALVSLWDRVFFCFWSTRNNEFDNFYRMSA